MQLLKVSFLMLFLFISIQSTAQVTRLTTNTSSDIMPKLLKDRQGRIWCFWLSNIDTVANMRRVFYKRYENGTWSPPAAIQGSANLTMFSYDVDMDTTGGIWLARIFGNTVIIFQKQPNDLFISKLTFVDSWITFYADVAITLVATDSNRIWIDYSRELFFYGPRWLYMYNGNQFVQKKFSTAFLTDIRTVPLFSMKTSNGGVHFLRSGTYDQHGSNAVPYAELISATSNDSFRLASGNWYSDITTAGSAQDTLLYFFSWTQLKDKLAPSLAIINASTNTTILRLANFDFFPLASSKDGSFLVNSWLKDNTIYLKGIKGSTLLASKAFSSNDLQGDTARMNISLLADTYPSVWVAWQGMVNGQNEIFVAKTEILTEPDTAIVVSVSPPNPFGSNQPHSFNLLQNYPNPFNPSTQIQYSVPSRQHIKITIYDVLGRLVETLADEIKEQGNYTITWRPTNLPSGVYLYRLESASFTEARKLILLR